MTDDPRRTLAINGHTNNVGPQDYNVKLSQSRAAAVVDALVAANIAPACLSSGGFGPDQPGRRQRPRERFEPRIGAWSPSSGSAAARDGCHGRTHVLQRARRRVTLDTLWACMLSGCIGLLRQNYISLQLAGLQ